MAVLPADTVSLTPLTALWLVAGIGQDWVNLPTETLLAERTEKRAQGRGYGAHLAWSRLWWAFAYPLTGLSSTWFPDHTFFVGGLTALAVWLAVGAASHRSVGT